LVAESSYECHNVYMWLKAYKSTGKLFDYGTTAILRGIYAVLVVHFHVFIIFCSCFRLT